MVKTLPERLNMFKEHYSMIDKPVVLIALILIFSFFISSCSDDVWNDPYPPSDSDKKVFYSSFGERPKHLDPARSYSSNEWSFISQIYEPPLQYHYLQRPYALIPLTASSMPEITYFDSEGAKILDASLVEKIAFTEYSIRIRKNIKYQPHPAFARNNSNLRYWPINEAQLKDKFSLSDFQYTGTRELVADDFVYQIKRLAFKPNHSPISGLMSEHIVGFKEFSDRSLKIFKNNKESGKLWTDLRTLDMDGVEIVDKYTFKVRIKKNYPQFSYWLAMNFFAPMPWEAERFYAQPGMNEKNINLNWYPIGTGPYLLSENNPNLRMVLMKNPNFRGESYPNKGSATDIQNGLLNDAGKEMPFIEKAIYSLEKESIPRWNKFLQGYYDNSGIVSDSFDQAVKFGTEGEASLTEDMKDKGIRLDTSVETSIFYMGFNMLDKVVGGNQENTLEKTRARKLRQAISIAINWEEFISIFLNGRGQVAQGILPPGIYGYRDGKRGINRYVYDWVQNQPKRKSIEDAKRLMNEAGYPDGINPKTGAPLILYYDTAQTGPGGKSIMQWYRKQFAKIGIQLVIRSSDYNRFQEKMLKGTSQIYSWGWNADYPDPENFMFLLYGPNGKANNQGENASNYQNRRFDMLFSKMKNLPNGEKRQKIIDEMVDILQSDSPWLFGFFPRAFSLHHSWYKNASPHLMANNTLKYKGIDFQERQRMRNEWNRPVLWPIALITVSFLIFILPAIRYYRRRERRKAI